jgi:hypothetical protein
LSASLDNPESGFDALYQVATCWQSRIDPDNGAGGRKLVLFISDNGILPHLAGDGKVHLKTRLVRNIIFMATWISVRRSCSSGRWSMPFE